MNRGRHRKKPSDGYPSEINQLLYPEIFKKAFTPEQTKLLLKRQADAGNSLNLCIFENNYFACKRDGGFDWYETEEGKHYWDTLLTKYYLLRINNLHKNT